ncbi:aminopeptidase [Dysgonomonas capnocytophagoides]|uniref:Aminopeptidase n=1 Tax=Dysgonomonas capnocytophagoides TaxID=45254 RepID=A0A4Y8KXC1_9BACT|nr:C1 family peptidase [Dysgonomonas capnocytophagoides]TFD94267.1 aminopeptidase [Dysgonomonas capnocytophagoides]
MKKIFIASVALLMTFSAWAQTDSTGYQFSVVKQNPITSIKNQGSSGTCWSFSGVGFLESELLKMGKGEQDLSEMYIVRRNYEDKAQKYLRLDGHLNFAQGGSFADVIETINEYGVVPNEAMPGLNYGETGHKHGELADGLTGYLEGIHKNGNKRYSTSWFTGFKGILDAYLGEKPQSFTYNGKTYTPQSWAKELGLDSNNYVSISSFTHHPFYTPFAVEVPDNWRWALSYNVPMDAMIKIMDNAIEKGYTIAWASDVSETGFTRNGLGVYPDDNAPENIGSDQAHWLGLSASQKVTELRKKIEAGPVKEIAVTQEMRQAGFDNQETTDDHGMQIFGIAKDQNGTKYYMVKNSWGETGKYKGIWYVSETFVKYKTISFVVNKQALPKDIADKLKL